MMFCEGLKGCAVKVPRQLSFIHKIGAFFTLTQLPGFLTGTQIKHTFHCNISRILVFAGHHEVCHLQDGDEGLGHGHSQLRGGAGAPGQHGGGGGTGLPLPDAPVPGQGFQIIYLFINK